MGANFNKWIGAGNLTRDPELTYTPKGTAVAKFSLAINRNWRDESGQQKEEVTFVDVTAFGKQAETISQYCKKGKPLLVECRLKTDTWDDKNSGQKRSKLGVVLESFQFLSDGQTREGEPRAQTPARPAAPAARPPTAGVPTTGQDSTPAEEDDDSNVPF